MIAEEAVVRGDWARRSILPNPTTDAVSVPYRRCKGTLPVNGRAEASGLKHTHNSNLASLDLYTSG